MESPQLLLNEAKMASLEDSKKSIFLFDWLKKLDIVLRNLTTSAQSTQISQNPEALIQDKEAVRKSQKQLVEQLLNLVQNGGAVVGPILRQLISDCLVALFTVGDTFLLFDTINKYVFFCTNVYQYFIGLE